MDGPATTALNIIVVEDELLLGMETAAIVLGLGHNALGPVTSLDDALAISDCNAIDAGILDFDIAGEMVVPLARLFEERGVPYIVCTGRPDAAKASIARPDIVILEKPVFRDALRLAIVSLLEPSVSATNTAR